MSKHLIIAAALTGFCGAALAQGGGGNPAFAAHRQAVEAFCANHAQECGDLKQLHQTARQICENKQSSVGDCQNARQAARAKAQALEAEGYPAPPAGHGMRGGQEGPGEGPGGPPPG